MHESVKLSGIKWKNVVSQYKEVGADANMNEHEHTTWTHQFVWCKKVNTHAYRDKLTEKMH